MAEGKQQKEWFEQADLICHEFAKNGSYNFVIKSDGKIDNALVSGVTIGDNNYLKVLNQLLANANNKQKEKLPAFRGACGYFAFFI